MKVTIVPAQITTVEDRIAGPLGLSQLMLLTIPIFGGSLLYVILPPGMHSASYKLVVITMLMSICGLLAIRIKGKILLFWLAIMLSYNLRPRYYVYNKNSLAYREQYTHVKTEVEQTEAKDQEPVRQRIGPALTTAELARAQAIMEHPDAHLAFETNAKGGLYAVFTEVKETS